MSRQDLLALTLDDLAVLSNRGLVKRALKELEENNLTYKLTEDARGNISLRWSDEVECSLPVKAELSDRHCSCPATTICRHLIRSVLAYQQYIHNGNNQQPITHYQHWNPGEIDDTELAKYFDKATLTRTRRQFESGQVVELIRSHKPTARIHALSHTVRFLVPADLRYTYCDCAKVAPCPHVFLAIWGFRLLDTDCKSGIVSTQTEVPVPVQLLDAIEQQLQAILEVGIRGMHPALIGRLQRLEANCRNAELIWLAEILAELLQEQERYNLRDARFSPTKVVALIGELCIRSDAIRHDTGAIPQLFVRGSGADITEIGAARLIGLGCGVEVRQRCVVLTAYLQDMDSGTVVAACREFTDPPQQSREPLLDFCQLAAKSVFKQVSFASLGAGQMLIQGGKRSPDYQFRPNTGRVAVNPQTYEWELLKPPLLVEDFASLQANLEILPPASLRPRRLTENFRVLAVSQVEDIKFIAAEQVVQAILTDGDRNSALLRYPYTSRSHAGTEALLTQLTNKKLLFVAGQIDLSAVGLVITPVSLVFQHDNTRSLLQPWIEAKQDFGSSNISYYPRNSFSATNYHPLSFFLQELETSLSNLVLLGLERTSDRDITDWQKIYDYGKKLGFTSFLIPVAKLIALLTQKERSLDDNCQSTAIAILEICVLLKLVQEQSYA